MSDPVQHKIIFADKESITPKETDLHIKKIWIDIYNEYISKGAVQSDGTIAWDCPCLGTQAIGPCSTQFRSAFSCYQQSNKEPNGSECIGEYMKMQNCFAQYPKLYNKSTSSDNIHKKEIYSSLYRETMVHPKARRQQIKEARKRNE